MGSGGIAPHILNPPLEGAEWSASCPRASLDAVAKRESPWPSWESTPGHPAHSL